MADNDDQKQQDDDELAESLNDLFLHMSTLIKSQLQGCHNEMELLDKMNSRVSQEYESFADLASGLRVFVHQLNSKASANYDDPYVHRIHAIEQHLTRCEALVASLDQHVSTLESNLYSLLTTTPISH